MQQGGGLPGEQVRGRGGREAMMVEWDG